MTYANLAATCVQLQQMEEAGEYAEKAKKIFEEAGIRDSHYAAALSAMGAWYFHRPTRPAAILPSYSANCSLIIGTPYVS